MKYYNKVTWNDRWIIETVFNSKQNGFFVEAGAQHGKWGSCTYALETELGWTGILVEPVDYMFKKLIKFRPNSKCFNVCLYDKNKEVDFVEFNSQQGNGSKVGWSGISENWLSKRQINPEDHEHKILKKKAITLEKLLIDGNAPKLIDYLALDIEGAEKKVLEKFPFNKYKFKAISIEGPGKVIDLLKGKGYIPLYNLFSEANIYTEGYFIHKDYVEIIYKTQ